MGLEYSQSRGGHDDRIYCTECMYKYMEKNARPLRNSVAVKGAISNSYMSKGPINIHTEYP